MLVQRNAALVLIPLKDLTLEHKIIVHWSSHISHFCSKPSEILPWQNVLKLSQILMNAVLQYACAFFLYWADDK